MRLLIFLSLFNPIFGQNGNMKNIYYYGDKSPERICEYKKETNMWTCLKYYTNGKIQSISYYDTTSSIPVGTKTTFGIYGEMSYLINIDDERLKGPFIEYYCNGQIKIQGSFFNSFRTGNWLEYYPNGILKTSKHYKINRQDSLLNDYKNLKDTTRRNNLKIEIGEFSELTSNSTKIKCLTPDSLSEPVILDIWYAMDGIKTGIWNYYNKNGKLIRTEKHK